MKRVIETLLLLLMVPGFSLAQPLQNNWDNLRQLAPGRQIQIVLNDAESYTGQFQSASDERLVMKGSWFARAVLTRRLSDKTFCGSPPEARDIAAGTR